MVRERRDSFTTEIYFNQQKVLLFDVPELDDILPHGGLSYGALHEVDGGGNGALHGLQKIVMRFKKDEILAKAAMAPPYAAAYGLARFQRQQVVIAETSQQCAYLDALPISAPRLPNEIFHSLRMLGFETISELEAAPRASLALRFGSIIGLKLDQAFSRIAEPITPLIPKNMLFAERFFAEPIATPESLARVTDILVRDLCATMESESRGARNLGRWFIHGVFG